jgi:hypothetical protein
VIVEKMRGVCGDVVWKTYVVMPTPRVAASSKLRLSGILI